MSAGAAAAMSDIGPQPMPAGWDSGAAAAAAAASAAKTAPRATPRGGGPDVITRRRFLDVVKYVPLRLTDGERELLGLLENALHVSEYTDEVDTVVRRNKHDRIARALEHVLAACSGLQTAASYNKGAALVLDQSGGRAAAGRVKTFAENKHFFQTLFEVGRRCVVATAPACCCCCLLPATRPPAAPIYTPGPGPPTPPPPTSATTAKSLAPRLSLSLSQVQNHQP